jgi:mono/diheme cytochrome c family protein
MSPVDQPQGREGHEPEEVPRGVPWVMAAFVVCIAGWGAYTFVTEVGSDGFSPHGDRRTVAALAPPPVEAPAAGGEAAAPDGEAIYSARCVACHQATGLGLAGAFPPLAESEWVVGIPERPVGIVLHGLQGAIEVKGVPYQGVMPAFKDQLSDGEIAAVVSYVRRSFGNDAPVVSAETVATVRGATEGRTEAIGGQDELLTLFP